MKSPVSPNTKLVRAEIEPGFVAFRCQASDGIWIPPTHYWKWRDGHTDELSPVEPVDITVVADSPAGKRCPEDGAFLIRHRVGHGLNFHIDRCGHCGGMWLDANEWYALKSAGLHESLHLIFTAAWQARVREQQREANQEQFLRDHLGEPDYEKATQVREWIDSHHKRPMILAFLNGEND